MQGKGTKEKRVTMEDASNFDNNRESSAEMTSSSSILSADSFSYSRTSSELSIFSDQTDGSSFGWPLSGRCSDFSRRISHLVAGKTDNLEVHDIELEMMKERFSKMLLGEDMSGGGKGVCTAGTISNAMTNLYASVFGRHLKLEPLCPDKKLIWKREMNCLLSVCDYIVEFSPAMSPNLRHGVAIEVMASRQRSDIHINLPALRKLDSMLLDILDSFEETEFWYAEQGSMSGSSTRSGSFRRILQPQSKGEKWWLPVPCVPTGGLSEHSRKNLRQKRDLANQIHKAASAINSTVLAEMEIPESFLESLPKSGKASVGHKIYNQMYTAGKFSPERVLKSLYIASEHEILETVDHIEAAMYIWRLKAGMNNSKTSSWDVVKDFVSDTDRSGKNRTLAERAEVLLFCFKQKYPELAQTSLDICKIQYNKDVGQAILESYSRVLEGLAFNTVAWLDDVLFIDKTTKLQD